MGMARAGFGSFGLFAGWVLHWSQTPTFDGRLPCGNFYIHCVLYARLSWHPA